MTIVEISVRAGWAVLAASARSEIRQGLARVEANGRPTDSAGSPAIVWTLYSQREPLTDVAEVSGLTKRDHVAAERLLCRPRTPSRATERSMDCIQVAYSLTNTAASFLDA